MVIDECHGSGPPERDLVARAIQAGRRDANDLANLVFFARHPAMTRRRINPRQRGLVREGSASGSDRPAGHRGGDAFYGRRPGVAEPPPEPRNGSGPHGRTTNALRAAWSPSRISGTLTPVNPLTRTAFTALEQILRSAGYKPRAWNYELPRHQGPAGAPLPARLRPGAGHRPPLQPPPAGRSGPARFSPAATQEQRCRDVQAGWADTAFTPAQVAAAEGLRTVDGLQVFAWGGRWGGSPDSMHFQINVSPQEIQRGVNPPLPPLEAVLRHRGDRPPDAGNGLPRVRASPVRRRQSGAQPAVLPLQGPGHRRELVPVQGRAGHARPAPRLDQDQRRQLPGAPAGGPRATTTTFPGDPGGLG